MDFGMTPTTAQESYGHEIVDFMQITRNWLHKASRLTMLPLCVRAQISLKAKELRQHDVRRSGPACDLTRSDVCQFCGLKFDATSTRYSIRRKHVKRKKHKDVLLQVNCNGCGKAAAPATLKRLSRMRARSDTDNVSMSTMDNSSLSLLADQRKEKNLQIDSRSSISSNKSIPASIHSSIRSNAKTPSKSANARKRNNVNKLRNMVAAGSAVNTSLSDFLKNISS